MALRLDLLRLAARALPPLEARSFDDASAAWFLVSAVSGEPSIFSPIKSSMTERARRLGSRGRLGMLAREGMILLSHYRRSMFNILRRMFGQKKATVRFVNFKTEAELRETLKGERDIRIRAT